MARALALWRQDEAKSTSLQAASVNTSRKPDEQYDIIQSCSWGPYLELFGRGCREGWTVWGNQARPDYAPDWKTYAYKLDICPCAMMLSDLECAGFDVQIKNHASAILTRDFPEPLRELCTTLLNIRIDCAELIRGGGGEAQSTQRLRRALVDQGWAKRQVVIPKDR